MDDPTQAPEGQNAPQQPDNVPFAVGPDKPVGEQPKAAKEPAQSAEQRLERRFSIFEGWMIALTIVGVTVAVVTGVIFWKQLGVMKGQLDEMHTTGVDTGKLAIAAVGKVPTITIFIENSGRTPAVDVSVAGTIIVRQNLSKEDLADTTVGERTSNMILGPKTPPGAILIDSDKPVTTQRQIDGITGGITRVYAIGAIYYKDIFGQPHKTRFCFSVGARDYGRGMAAYKEHNTVE